MVRNIGMGLYSVLQKNGISFEEAAARIGYSLRDTIRIIEGKLFLSPVELNRIADIFNTTSDYLLKYKPESSCLVPELEYNKEFTHEDNLYKILDLLDEYIEIKEQM